MSWYYPVNQSISIEEWHDLSSSKHPEFDEIREAIEENYLLVKSHVNLLVEKKMFSLKQLKNSIRGTNKISINSLFLKRIKELRIEGQIGTMVSMQSTLSILEKRFKKDIPIESIDLKWLEEYAKYLNKTKKQATVYVHFRNIRTMMNIAIKQGYISKDKYPFGYHGYQFKVIYGRKKALTLKQVKAIADLRSKSHILKRYRDLFIFMYLCNGITVDDLIMLKYENIYDGEICFVRGKTRRTTNEIKEIKATITPEMKKIIRRWGNKEQSDNYLFPLIKHTTDAHLQIIRKNTFNKLFNQNLRIIAGLLGIDDLTTVMARHSFATILKNSGVSVAFISESLGHKNITTTEHYLNQFEKEARKKNSSYLLKFES